MYRKENSMADVTKRFQFSLQFIEPSETIMASARKLVASPDENRRSVAKALLDATAAGLAIKKAMEENRDADMAPYLDFWFADASSNAEQFLHCDDEEARDVAQCLIDVEKAAIKSKESVLAEIKRLGLKPGNG
jgi:hypothetical protein